MAHPARAGPWTTPTGLTRSPECDGKGEIVGFSFRAEDGRKGSPSGAKTGSRRGLIIPDNLADLPGVVLVVEGASDVAAGFTLGIPAVGRPSNASGADDLAELLRDREVLIVGERDQKPDGRWPGRDGAIKTAQALARLWGKPVRWTLPPEGVKDIREAVAGDTNISAGLLMEALEGNTQTIEPPNADTGDGGDKEKRPSQSELIVRLALQQYRFGRTDAGEVFAVERDGPNVALMLRGSSESLRAKLAREFRRQYGTTPNASALADALTALAGEAQEAQPEPVALRVATHGDGIVIDMGEPEGRAVVVGAGVWGVVARSPVLFRRTALTGVMPIPQRGGNLGELRALVNVTPETWPLLRGYMVAALMPDVPHPILLIGGEQGAGKSTAARMLFGLIDPSPAPLRSEPRDPEGWAMAAAGSCTVCLDNISSIPGWFSDALCKAVTGDGWVRRTLYTDSDISVLAFRRVVALTSIDAGALRGDLGDRLLMVDLERIPDDRRRPEAEILAAYNTARARLIGALLDDLARVHKILPIVQLKTLPRMADFGRVLAALDATDGPDGRALQIYLGQGRRVVDDVLEGDPVAAALLAMLARVERGEWEGTADALLKILTPARPPRAWPGSPRALSGAVRRLAPALRSVGIEVSSSRGRTRDRTRLLNIKRVDGDRPDRPTVQPSNRPTVQNIVITERSRWTVVDADPATVRPTTEVSDSSGPAADSRRNDTAASPDDVKRAAEVLRAGGLPA